MLYNSIASLPVESKVVTARLSVVEMW